MQFGIKTGLRNDFKKDIVASQPDFCEIWFNAAKISAYDDLMQSITYLGPQIGLHYWGALKDGTLSNIAYPDAGIRQESINLIKQTIDYAAKFKCIYVNIHPSGRLLTRVDFEAETYAPYSGTADITTCVAYLKTSLAILADYAYQRGVLLTVETAPKYALGNPWHGSEGRAKPLYVGEFSMEEIGEAYDLKHVYFAHDFGHTAAQIVSPERQKLKDYVFNIARRLLPKTKLLHVSYIIPPFNGSDYHGCLYNNEVYTDSAVPNHKELMELIRLYKDASVYALVEPEKDHVGNFLALKKLVQEATTLASF